MASMESVCREVLEGATELRLMLCREKRTGTRVGTSVIAACGAPRNFMKSCASTDQRCVGHLPVHKAASCGGSFKCGIQA